MIERQIESPIPMPLDLVVKKALTPSGRSAFSAEIPTPQSVTLTSTRCVSSGPDRITGSRPIRDRLHCFNAIHRQVNNHLLQLDPIGQNHG
jgi:hypothetical protein